MTALSQIENYPHPQFLPHRERKDKPFSRCGKGWDKGDELLPITETSIFPILQVLFGISPGFVDTEVLK